MIIILDCQGQHHHRTMAAGSSDRGLCKLSCNLASCIVQLAAIWNLSFSWGRTRPQCQRCHWRELGADAGVPVECLNQWCSRFFRWFFVWFCRFLQCLRFDVTRLCFVSFRWHEWWYHGITNPQPQSEHWKWLTVCNLHHLIKNLI